MTIFALLFIFGVLNSAVSGRTLNNAEKVVNGQSASLGQFPHHVMVNTIVQDGSFLCGGALIDANTVLTAAHCVWDMFLGEPHENMGVRISAGHIALSTCTSGTQERYAAQAYVHPEWDSTFISKDIAVIKFSTGFTLGGNINSIALPSSMQNFTGNCTLQGWGVPFFGGSPAQTLQWLTVPMVPLEPDCKVHWFDLVSDTNVCAGGICNQGACQGDSGGALFCTVNGKPTHTGIVSFGRPPCGACVPDGYTATSRFVNFINTPTGTPQKLLSDYTADKIQGANMAKREQFPWQVSLVVFSDDHTTRCGGIIINENTVLTSATCMIEDENDDETDALPPNLRIYADAGFYNNDKCNNPRQRIWASKVALHDGILQGLENVALVTLSSKFTFNSNVGAVTLPDENFVFNNANCSLIGRGIELHDLAIGERLMYSNVMGYSQSATSLCKAILGNAYLRSHEVCAMVDGTEDDICRGDIGGPLYCDVGGKWALGGVLSWRDTCLEENPYVFTSASAPRVRQFLNGMFQNNLVANTTVPKNFEEIANVMDATLPLFPSEPYSWKKGADNKWHVKGPKTMKPKKFAQRTRREAKELKNELIKEKLQEQLKKM